MSVFYKLSFSLLLIWTLPSSYAQKYRADIYTDFGKIKIILFDKTPTHRDNFIRLCRKGFYEDLLFHRVIPEFMIQGGDPESKNAPNGKQLGDGDLSYRLPAEFVDEYFHQRGALAQARDDNPTKASSASQFYIVTGKKFTEKELEALSKRQKKIFTARQKDIYTSIGGAPHLDGNYTVYGQVIEGMPIADSIASVTRDEYNRPHKDIHIKKIKIKKKRWGIWW